MNNLIEDTFWEEELYGLIDTLESMGYEVEVEMDTPHPGKHHVRPVDSDYAFLIYEDGGVSVGKDVGGDHFITDICDDMDAAYRSCPLFQTT